jgi:hypothetical protein
MPGLQKRFSKRNAFKKKIMHKSCHRPNILGFHPRESPTSQSNSFRKPIPRTINEGKILGFHNHDSVLEEHPKNALYLCCHPSCQCRCYQSPNTWHRLCSKVSNAIKTPLRLKHPISTTITFSTYVNIIEIK